MTETAFGYLQSDDHAWLSTDERKWVTWAKKMAKEYPDEVQIKSEFKDGTITVAIPKSWFKLSPPKKIFLTEEERNRRAERLRNTISLGKK